MAVRIGKLRYDPNKILGQGSFGDVFSGFYIKNYFVGAILGGDKPVAIKRIEKLSYGGTTSSSIFKIKKEVELMKAAKDHPNILRYVCTEMNDDFLFIATELCFGTLHDYFNPDGNRYQGPRFLSEWQILHQVTKGLDHLHSLEIVHRDMKPTNILIFVVSSQNDPQVKLADFGISTTLNYRHTARADSINIESNHRNIERGDFTNTNANHPSGTKGWMAPELYGSDRFDFKVDIFPLGCIFFYTLSKGQRHPFGDDSLKRENRIKNKKKMLLFQSHLKYPYSEDRPLFKLIMSMLDMNPTKRPTVAEVISSPFFLVDSDRTRQLLVICRPLESSLTIETAYFEKLVKDYVDVNAKTPAGETPLQLLCKHYKEDNLLELIKILLKKGAVDVDIDKNRENSFLILLFKNNYEFYHRNNYAIWWLLFRYSFRQAVAEAKQLVSSGRDVNNTSDGWFSKTSKKFYNGFQNILIGVLIFSQNGFWWRCFQLFILGNICDREGSFFRLFQLAVLTLLFIFIYEVIYDYS